MPEGLKSDDEQRQLLEEQKAAAQGPAEAARAERTDALREAGKTGEFTPAYREGVEDRDKAIEAARNAEIALGLHDRQVESQGGASAPGAESEPTPSDDKQSV